MNYYKIQTNEYSITVPLWKENGFLWIGREEIFPDDSYFFYKNIGFLAASTEREVFGIKLPKNWMVA